MAIEVGLKEEREYKIKKEISPNIKLNVAFMGQRDIEFHSWKSIEIAIINTEKNERKLVHCATL